jgi:hypothetical protein
MFVKNSEIGEKLRYILYLLAACCLYFIGMGCMGSKKSEDPLPKAKYADAGEVRQEVSFEPTKPFEIVVKKVPEAKEEEKSNDSDKPQWRNREFLGLPQEREEIADSKINIIFSSDKEDLPNLTGLTDLTSSPIPVKNPQLLPISVIQEMPLE